VASLTAFSSRISFLLRRLSGATGVLALTTVGSTIVRLISSIVLTRLLSPSVFGLAGIIGSLFFVIVMMTDLGFEAFLIRHPQSDDQQFRDVIWTVHAWRGLLLMGAGIVSSPLVAMVLHKPELSMPLALASVTLGINGLASFSLIIALKSGGARKLSLFDLGLTIFQTTLCIGLAVWLRNIWALVAAMIAQSLLRTALSYAMFSGSSHRFARNRETYREFFSFSRIVLATSFVTLLISQSDKLFLARFLSLQQYGLYAIAINLVSVPTGFVGTYISRIVYPLYTRTWNNDPKALAGIYYKVRQRTSLLFALGSGALVGGAPLLVAIIYDARYRGAALFVSLLGISAALRLPTFAAAEVMTAIGKISVTLRANIVRVLWLAIAGPFGFYLDGGTGVICVVGLIEVPALFYSWIELRKVGVLDMRYEIGYLGTFLAGGLAAYAVSLAGLCLLGR
jgi:lipopolysaccharide exporter